MLPYLRARREFAGVVSVAVVMTFRPPCG